MQIRASRFATLALPALLALCGCATPETRLRTGLERGGIAPSTAACMAERMVDRLSLLQLRRIGDLPKAGDAATLDRFLHRVRALGDSEIWGVTSSSAALCATGLANESR